MATIFNFISLLNSFSTRWGWVVAIMPQPCFLPLPREITLSTHWLGGWVCPRAGLDAESRRKSLDLAWDWTLVDPSVSRHYTESATQALAWVKVNWKVAFVYKHVILSMPYPSLLYVLLCINLNNVLCVLIFWRQMHIILGSMETIIAM